MSKNVLLSAKDLANPHKIDRSWLDSLIQHFSQVDDADADSARKLVRCIVDGTDSDVVLELGGKPSIGTALRLHLSFLGNNDRGWNYTKKKAKEREQFLWPKTAIPAEVWMRVGQVFEALYAAGNVKATVFLAWPGWLRALLGAVMAVRETHPANAYWEVDRLEEIFEQAGFSRDTPGRILLDTDLHNEMAHLRQTFLHGYVAYHDRLLMRIHGWPAHFARHVAVVRDMLQAGNATARDYALRTLLEVKFDFTPIQDLLVELAVGNAKTVRETALLVLGGVSDGARPMLEKMLAEGDTSQRHEAVQAYWKLYGADGQAVLEKHAQTEASDRVKQTITRLIAAPTEAAAAAPLPPLDLPLGEVPLGEKAKAELRAMIERAFAKNMEHFQRAMAEYEKADPKGYRYKPHKPQEITAADIDNFIDYVETGKKIKVLQGFWQHEFSDAFSPPEMQLIHVARMAHGFQHLQGSHWRNSQSLEAYRGRCPQKFGLREVDAAVATLDVALAKPGAVAYYYLLSNTKYMAFANWEDEAIWPVFAEHLDLLHEALLPSPNRNKDYQHRDYSWSIRHDNAFKVLAAFPRLPAEFVPVLWDLALGESKSDRLPAQKALDTVPGKSARIVEALSDGKQTVRAAAAEWLADSSAIEPIKEAFRKEKQELVKGALLTALEAVGGNVEEFLDRNQLIKDAEAGLAKKKPKGMEWLPLESLPQLHWQDTGKRVEPAIVQWWAVQSIAQKNPIAGPLLRRYLGMCRPTDAAQLSRWFLRTWIGADTAPLAHEEAADRAKRQSDAEWANYLHYSQQNASWKDMMEARWQNKKENLYQEHYNRLLGECKGSAIGEKGILALVSAAGDAECAKLAEQYIRKWFGQRLAQCKALIEVLAWIDHPSAVQVLLAIGNRFRTKSIRDAAAEHVRSLAERQGWTLDELADRTLPDAGFERAVDDAGRPVGDEATLTLDYGPRSFIVKLNDDLDPVITTAEGKTVKAPPAPGKNDDAEKAKEAKKRFSDAKKTVKQVVKSQSERLYESMCTQRRWRFEDWQRYLAQHPIVGRLCTRLVWARFDGDGENGLLATGCFRPLEDGSLTNENDEAVTPAADAILRLAHTGNVPAELEADWKQHLADYDVEPLFPQFGQPVYSLPDAKKKESDIKDFEGHLLSSFKLRGKATKLGYLRGPAEDGGWFHFYRKPFMSLEMEAVINFTGSGLPEEDRTVALLSFGFQRLKKDGGEMGYFDNAAMPLEKVPAVLLSECYNDVKRIAAEGSGFDPEWNKKAYY